MLLWITAKAGCGKTTLAAHISESVSSNHRSGGSSSFGSEMEPVVLTFFFQRNYQEAGQTSLTALNTFAAQLSRQQPATLPVLLQRYKRLSAEGGFTWSWANMSSVFSDMLRCLQPGKQVFVILDAIDECETTSAASIVDWIDKLVHVSDQAEPRLQIKVLATSRPDGMLLDTLNDVPTLAIQESDTANDIEMFINTQVEHFAHQRQLRPEISRSIAHFLKTNAQGMFLWVVLIMKELERRDARLTDAVIAQRLSTIPLTLVETYTRIIQAPPAVAALRMSGADLGRAGNRAVPGGRHTELARLRWRPGVSVRITDPNRRSWRKSWLCSSDCQIFPGVVYTELAPRGYGRTTVRRPLFA
jgi:hypothetical protein